MILMFWQCNNQIVCLFVCLEFSVPLKNFSLIIAGWGLQLLTYAWNFWPLSSEGSLACHTYCDKGHPFTVKFRNSHTWEARSPQPETVTKTPTPGSAKPTKLLQCWNGDPLDVTSTLRSGSLTATTSASCMDQNAGRHMWHQRENWKPPTYPQDILAKSHLKRKAAQNNPDVNNIRDHPKRRWRWLGRVLRTPPN